MASSIKLTECPRDAMQGLHNFVPTDIKAAYINLLLQVGFNTIDFGSFVSPKAIPQMRDTADVLAKLDLSKSKSKLLAIIANLRGAEEAVQFDEVSYLGFPFSISETFQQRNTNSGIADAFITIERAHGLCNKAGKKLLVYLSMGFGNPYGDEWSIPTLSHWAEQLINAGITDIAVADTIGVATPAQITEVFTALSQFKTVEFGAHLHSTPNTSYNKIQAAYQSGCTRFDSALKGFGGCPMAADDLTGNIATENVISFMQQQGIELGLDMDKWNEAMAYSGKVFG